MKQQVNQPRVNQSHPNRPDPHGPRFLQAVEGWEQTEELQRKITATGRKLTGSEWFAIVRCFNQGCSHRMDIGDGNTYCSCMEFIHDVKLGAGQGDTRTLLERAICTYASNKNPKVVF